MELSFHLTEYLMKERASKLAYLLLGSRSLLAT